MAKNDLLARGSGLFKEGALNKLTTTSITVVGAGAIGSWLGIALAKLGVENVTFYDNDVVEESNYNNQIFSVSDIGKHKLDALKGYMKAYSPFTDNWQYIKQLVTKDTEINSDILVLAVDSIQARQIIFEANRRNENLKLVLDGRIGRSIAMGISVDMLAGVEMDYYNQAEIYPSAQSARIPCTEKTFIAPCQFISAYMSAAIRSFVNGSIARYPFKVYIDFENFNVQQTKRDHSLFMRVLK